MNNPVSDSTTELPRRNRFSGSIFWATIALEIALVAACWGAFARWRGLIEAHRNDDPHGIWTSVSLVGGCDTHYERTLPDGRRINIDNRHTRFLADMKPRDAAADRLFPNFAAAIDYAKSENLPVLNSASMIDYWFKRRDDTLIESVQIDVQARMVELLKDLNAELAARAGGGENVFEARAFVAAGLKIAREDPGRLPLDLTTRVDELIGEFESGQRSAEHGFDEAPVAERYDHNEMRTLFRTHRYLMGPLTPEAAQTLLEIIRQNSAIRKQFEAIDAIHKVLDGPADVRHLMSVEEFKSDEATFFMPISASPESRFRNKLYGTAYMPDATNWSDKVVEGLKSGEMAFDIRPDSGWYDRKFYALVPLLRSDQAYEMQHAKMRATHNYRAFMEETFRSALTAHRETHVIRIATIVPMGIGHDRYTTPTLALAPEFSCEPTPALYWRLARAYRYLAENLPTTATAEAARLAEIAESVAGVAFLETGIPPDAVVSDPLPKGFPHAQAAKGWTWLASLTTDSTTRTDPRLSLQTAEGERMWGIVGVRLRKVQYDYEAAPQVEGYIVDKRPAVYYAPVLVSTEFRGRVHGQFREYCDRFDSVSKCLAALGNQSHKEGTGQIGWPAALTVLSCLVGLHLTWRVYRRRKYFSRPRPQYRHPILRRWFKFFALSAAWVVVFFLCLPPFVFLVAPRLDLPRAYTVFASMGTFKLYARFSFRTGFISSWYFVEWLDAAALRSDAQCVRENALNTLDCDIHGPHIQDALLDVAMTRGYDEAIIAVENLSCSGDDWNKVKAILARFNNDPKLVLGQHYLMKEVPVDKDDAKILERAILHSKPNEWEYQYALESLLDLHPEALPYDYLVSIGLLPADAESLTTGTLPSLAVVNAMVDYNHRLADDLDSSVTRARRERIQRVNGDLRLADLVYWYTRRAPEPSPGGRRNEAYFCELSGEQFRRCVARTVDWLVHVPTEQMVSHQCQFALMRVAEYYHADESVQHAALNRLLASRWKDQPHPKDYRYHVNGDEDCKTWGDVFTYVLNRKE